MTIQPNTLDESARAYSQTSDELVPAYASFFEKIANALGISSSKLCENIIVKVLKNKI